MNINLKPVVNDFSAIKEGVAAVYLEEAYGSELAATQLALEHEAYTLGEARFHKMMERQMKAGQFADNAAAKPLMGVLMGKLAERTTAWVAEIASKKCRQPHAYKTINIVGVEKACAITLKVLMGRLAKEENVNMTNLANSIGSAMEDEARYGSLRELEGKYFEKHIAKALNQRTDAEHKKIFLSAVISHLSESQKKPWESWSKPVVIATGIRMLEGVIEATGLIETDTISKGTSEEQRCVWLAPEYVDQIAKRAFSLAGMAPVHQPMVVPPKPWTDIKGGGYHAQGRKPLSLIRTGSKKALMRYADVSMPEVYESINIIQNTGWKVNQSVLSVVNVIKEMANPMVESLPSFEKGSLPEREAGMDEQPETLKRWKKAASAVYRKEKARVSRRLSMEFLIEQANKFSSFATIWFPYNMDWRGRVYAVSSFNPQSDDMGKGLLTLAEGKPLGASGMYWLKFHAANCAGVDKVELKDRIQWVEDNQQNIIDSANSPLDFPFWAEQDSPFCFLAACIELRNAWAEGLGYVCSLPVAFDGSCSGIQHFSAMLRDEIGGAAVNLTPSDKPRDIYGIVAGRVNEMLDAEIESGSENSVKVVTKDNGEITERLIYGTKALAQMWKDYVVTRTVTKRSVMTLAYGSAEFGFRDQILEDTVSPSLDAGETFFADAQQCAGFMAKLIWVSVGQVVVKAVEAMKWLQSAASLLAATVKDKEGNVIREALPTHWVTSDGFPVWQEYRKPEQTRLNLLFLGSFHIKPTINIGVKEIDKHKQKTGIAPNFVHSQDGAHLRRTVRHAAIKHGIESFAVIHDSFGTIPADAGSLFVAVREAMVDTYEHHDVIQDFYEQFADQLHESQLKKLPAVPAKGNLDIRDILKSDFAFA